MKSIINKLYIILVILVSIPAIASPEQKISDETSETTVVFMRSSVVGMAIKASVYEIVDDETIFIGMLKNNKRINFNTTPGNHTFMVIAESADFMQADLASGKTYYSVIKPRMGMMKARFSMYPIRSDGTSKFNTDSNDFKKLKRKTQVFTMSEDNKTWYQKHKKKFEKKRTKYWKKWQKKPAEKIAEKTLNPEDGI
jgi:hypothetical protein